MDLADRVYQILEQWSYATIEEIANEIPISNVRVSKVLGQDSRFEMYQGNHGKVQQWAIKSHWLNVKE